MLHKCEFERGDIVRHTNKFLRSICWYTGVPINGRVDAVTTLGKVPLLMVQWCDQDEAKGILAINVERTGKTVAAWEEK